MSRHREGLGRERKSDHDPLPTLSTGASGFEKTIAGSGDLGSMFWRSLFGCMNTRDGGPYAQKKKK